MNIRQLLERRKKTLLVSTVFVCLMVCYLAFTSPKGVVINTSGEIAGISNQLREILQGKHFWESQREQIQEEITYLFQLPQRQAALNQEVNELMVISQRATEEVYKEHPHLRPSPAQRQADYLRERADTIEDADNVRLERLDAIQEIERLKSIQKIVSIQINLE